MFYYVCGAKRIVSNDYPVDKNQVSTQACLPGQPGIQIQPGKTITKFTKNTKNTKYELWKLYKLQHNILSLYDFYEKTEAWH